MVNMPTVLSDVPATIQTTDIKQPTTNHILYRKQATDGRNQFSQAKPTEYKK